MRRKGVIKTEPETNRQNAWTEGQKDYNSFVKTDAPFVYSYYLKDIKEKFNQQLPIFKHYYGFIKDKPSVAGTSLLPIKRHCSRTSLAGLDFFPLSVMEQRRLSSSNEDFSFNSAIFHTFYIINILPINIDETIIFFLFGRA